MHQVILHYCIPLWIYGRTWTLWSFFNMGNTLPKLHQIIKIAYNNNPNDTHGRTITSFDAYQKVTQWFVHHMNGLVLFKRYTRSLDILELSVLIAFSLLITIGDMYVQVRNIIVKCEQCDKVRTSFSFRQFMFFPLPIQGMFYCWSCDLAGELPQTSRGNVYIMIMIKHFSKWVELVALSDKSSHSTS
jgi:hypothetical protein